MNNQWVDFSNLRQYWEQLGNIDQNFARNWVIDIWFGNCFLEIWYMYESTFKFPAAHHLYQNQTWEKPFPTSDYSLWRKWAHLFNPLLHCLYCMKVLSNNACCMENMLVWFSTTLKQLCIWPLLWPQLFVQDVTRQMYEILTLGCILT